MKPQFIFLSLFLKGLFMLVVLALCYMVKPPQTPVCNQPESCLKPKKEVSVVAANKPTKSRTVNNG